MTTGTACGKAGSIAYLKADLIAWQGAKAVVHIDPDAAYQVAVAHDGPTLRWQGAGRAASTAGSAGCFATTVNGLGRGTVAIDVPGTIMSVPGTQVVPHFVSDHINGPGVSRQVAVTTVDVTVAIAVGRTKGVDPGYASAGRSTAGNEVRYISVEAGASQPE